MTDNFGTRVTGKSQAEHDADQAAATAGKQHFGVRVTGELPAAASASHMEKANSEFGPRVVAGANPKPEQDLYLPIAQLERTLNQNPTFLDSLLEAEYTRPGGPRKEALMLFRAVEQGPSGAGRVGITSEIDSHLTGSGQPGAAGARQAAFDREADRATQDEKDRARNEKLRDAGAHLIQVPVTSDALLKAAKDSSSENASLYGAHSDPSLTQGQAVGGAVPSSKAGRTRGKTSANTGLGSATPVANTGIDNPDLSANSGLSAEQSAEGAEAAPAGSDGTKSESSSESSSAKKSARKSSARKSRKSRSSKAKE